MSSDPSAQPPAAPLAGSGSLRVLLAPSAEDAEASLIARAQGGDRHAMHDLLAPWNDRIFCFLHTLLRNRADAEDAAQETFLRVVKGLPAYEHSGQFQAWIYRIARNQAALTAERRNRLAARETAVEQDTLHDFAQTDAAPDDLAERAAQLHAAVETLPPAEREVVRLRLAEDLKFREIADRTGAPLNTVLGRMRNAMQRLRDQLDFLNHS
jgi:RNA polymerase sigma-70 factor, ECF subfamily